MLKLSSDGITVKVILDSVSTSNVRITTFACTYPRFIHSELMTHRDISRNAASSRAIPVEKMIKAVQDDPAMPVFWGKNQKGMQAAEELAEPAKAEAVRQWLEARDRAIEAVRGLQALDLHKQISNRILEPWMKITTIMTATRYGNLFFQRCHPAAQPEFQALARLMAQARRLSKPILLQTAEWHAPFIRQDDLDEIGPMPVGIADGIKDHPLLQISAARCARVSYLNHEGVRSTKDDLDLAARLLHNDQPEEPGHFSPFEHVAMAAVSARVQSGNFHGYVQLRKMFGGRENRENDFNE